MAGKGDLPDNLRYSKWDHIEVSDDEGDSHPNIDQKLMARLKKEKRQREYEEFRKSHPDAPDPIRAEELESTKDRTVINSDKVDPEEMKEAAKKKDEGNGYFSKGDYARAEELFTEAIAMTEALDFTKPEMVDARKKRAVFFNNRAAARANQGNQEGTIEDTTAAIKYDFRYVKARLRRAQTYEQQEKWKEAHDDYKRAMSYEPSNKAASQGVDRMVKELREAAESKLIEITIPDPIPENRIITQDIPGHGPIELELPEDAVPGQTIKLQLEGDDEEEETFANSDEGDQGGGLHNHANLYQKSLDVYLTDQVLKTVFMERWAKMPEGSRLSVIDRTFDVMVQQTASNTSGYKMSKKDFFKLCPEIAPEKRAEMSKDPKAFLAVCSAAAQDTDKKCQEWLTNNKESLKEVEIAFGLKLQFNISVETEGGVEVMAPIRRLLIAETLVCVYEALTGKKASEMPHMAFMR